MYDEIRKRYVLLTIVFDRYTYNNLFITYGEGLFIVNCILQPASIP